MGGVEDNQHLFEVGLCEINQSDFGVGQLQCMLDFHIVHHAVAIHVNSRHFAFLGGGLSGMSVLPAVGVGFSRTFSHRILDLTDAVVGTVAGQHAIHRIVDIAGVGGVTGQSHRTADVFLHLAALDHDHRHVVVVLKGTVDRLGEQGLEAGDADFLHLNTVGHALVPLFQHGVHREAGIAQALSHGRHGIGLNESAVNTFAQVAGADAQHADLIGAGIQGQGAIVLQQHSAFGNDFAVELLGCFEHFVQRAELAVELATVDEVVGTCKVVKLIALGQRCRSSQRQSHENGQCRYHGAEETTFSGLHESFSFHE